MTKIHRDALRSEISSVRSLLNKMKGKDPLGERSMRQRLAVLEADLGQMVDTEIKTANVALVFDGEPVRGSSGIEVDFAGKALQDYQELIAKHIAASELGGLAERGRLPEQINQKAKMNITSLVHGSFGFVLEEDGADELEMFETPAFLAVHKITDLLTSVSDSDDKSFEIALEELDVRIFQTLKRFIGTLHKSKATLRVAEDERELKLDVSRVSRAFDRVSQVEIEEDSSSFEGELLGLVPIQRRFDFRRAEDGEVLQGRVAANLSADYLERIEREGIIAGKRWRADIDTKTVYHPDGRHTKVTYTLVDLVELTN